MDSEIFNMEEFEGADWVLVSDETPMDENRRDELLEAFQVHYHPGARPEIMPTGDGTIVISFGPRRGNGAYVVDPEGSPRWVTPARYAAA